MASSKKGAPKNSSAASAKLKSPKPKKGSAASPVAPTPATPPPPSAVPATRDLRSFEVNGSLTFSEQDLIDKKLAFGLFFDLNKLTPEQRIQLWAFVNDVKFMAAFCAVASSHDGP